MDREIYHKILYFYFQDYIFHLPDSEREKFVQQGLWRKLKAITIAIYLSQKKRASSKSIDEMRSVLEGKKWVFVFGKNNYEATKFLSSNGFVFISDSKRNYKTEHDIFVLPVRRRLRYFFSFIPVIRYLLSTEGKRVKVIFDAVFASMGWVEAFREIIEVYRPKAIVFSNDHSIIPRALFLTAKEYRVPTFYVQHATIAKEMPPLEYDLSLLEGADAFDKYSLKGIKGQVQLIGIPRFDAYVSRRRAEYAETLTCIGIAFNTVDSFVKVIQIVKAIKDSRPDIQIILRGHPKDRRDFESGLVEIMHLVTFSDSRTESPFDFILRCDLLIAGDSSIHLEAKMLNVESVFYDLASDGSTIHDLYGYRKNNLIKSTTSLPELIEFIHEPAFEQGVSTKYYNDALGTAHEGRSSAYAIESINQFLFRWK